MERLLVYQMFKTVIICKPLLGTEPMYIYAMYHYMPISFAVEIRFGIGLLDGVYTHY